MPRWTEEARRKQAEIQKTRRSWEQSTGPKTDAGKARSRLNAWKDGYHCKPAKDLRAALLRHSQFLKEINAMITMEKRLARLSDSPSLLPPALLSRPPVFLNKTKSGVKNEQT